jgi:biopolymer transport protein ExbD
MMLVGTREDDLPSLNVTPLIDMVFLLIIFFLVGTQFRRYESERQLDVQVPKVASSNPLVAAPAPLVIEVLSDGTVRCAGKTSRPEELEKILQDHVRAQQHANVLVRGDGRAAYQHIAQVLGLCHKVGVRQLAVSVRAEPLP